MHSRYVAALFTTGMWTLLVMPVRVSAQTLPERDSVLARLTAQAIAANPSLEASRARAVAAERRIGPAGALPDPMLSAGVMDLTLPRFAFRESDFTEVDLELSQEFPWPGTLGARAQAARAETRSRQAEVAARRLDIVVRTAELYYRLRYLVTARAILARQRTLLATALDIATSRYASTAAPQSDPLQARVAAARLDAEDADLAEQQAKAGAELKALRRLRGAESLALQLIDPEQVSLALHRSLPDSLIVPDSLSLHPRVAARQAALDAAERTVRAERLGARPEFSITTRYGARPLGSDFFSAFVGIRVPLWAGRKLAGVARAEADVARAELEEEMLALESELETARAAVASGGSRLQLLVTQVVPSGRASVEAALRSYRVGQAPFLNVLAAEDSLYRAELEAVMVAADHLAQLVVLEQLLAREDAS
jgi:outer membrane protein, heavy metal efflux system